jgi:hypothetical protein
MIKLVLFLFFNLYYLCPKYKILLMMELDWQVEISHTYREANKCADASANIDCSTGYDIMYYESCPSQISELYLADSLGITAHRLISV